MQDAFLHLRVTQRGVVASGTESAHLGHTVARGSGHPPDGVFVSWRWDGKRLTLENDRYGFYPAYYYCRPDEFCVSTSLLCLFQEGASSELDYGALLTFLRLGFFLAEDTPFREVLALPPAARFVWKDGKLEARGGYTWGKPAGFSRDEAIDGYISCFREAMRQRIGSGTPFAVPLSGGRDSRHILLELEALGHQPEFCVTHRYYPPKSDEDVAVAARVARSLDVDHRVVDQNLPRFEAEFKKNVLTNFCTDEHAQVLCLADYLGGRTHAIYDGIAGDVLSAGLFLNAKVLNLFEAGQWSGLIDHVEQGVFTRAARFLASCGLLSNELDNRRNREEARERMRTEFRRHSGAPNPVSSFYFWNRTRREIALAPFTLLRNVPVVYAPYVDHAVYDLLSSLPAKFFLDKMFHTDAIARAYPQHADSPFAAPGWRSTGLRRQSRELARSVRRLLARGGEGRLLQRKRAIPWIGAAAGLPRPNTGLWLTLVYLAQLDEVAAGRRNRRDEWDPTPVDP